MANSFTSNLGLTKPEVGADTNLWGGHTNGNWDTVDGIFTSASTRPISVVMKSDSPFVDAVTTTKKILWSLTGISTTTTRTLAVQDTSGTVALLSDVTAAAIRVQTFAASGTYTPAPNMLYCIIEVVGGGGAGGGCVAAAASLGIGGAGGGAGSYSRKVASSATIGASQVVTIGAAGAPGAPGNNPGGNGGDTSVGSLCIGKGGTGGGPGTNGNVITGGLGGVSGTGDGTPPTGMPGGGSGVYTNGFGMGGAGGTSPFGGGAPQAGSSSAINGLNGSGFGSGGGGGASYNGAGTGQTGGAGTAGYVVITEYCSK